MRNHFPISYPLITRFPLGQIVATPDAVNIIKQTGQQPAAYLLRHQTGDWGDVPPAVSYNNELSLAHGYQIVSTYTLAPHRHIIVITTANRETTCILVSETSEFLSGCIQDFRQAHEQDNSIDG